MKVIDIEIEVKSAVRRSSAIMSAKCVLFACLAMLAVACMVTMIDADRVIRGLPAQIESDVAALRGEIVAARVGALEAINSQGDALRNSAVSELHGARLGLQKEIHSAAAVAILRADDRVGDALVLAHHHAQEFEGYADDFEKITLALATPARDILKRVDAATPEILLDEEHIANNLAAEIPKITLKTEAIETKLDHIATGIDALIPQKHHTPFWLRLLGFGR